MSDLSIELLGVGTFETLYMVFIAGIIAILAGLPLGVLLYTTRRHGILENSLSNKGLSFIINVVRSIPFIILMIALIPFTRLIVGTSIGTHAAIVPLTIAAIPFVARIVENALVKTGEGLVESGIAMGAHPFQIITKIMLPESLPSIIQGMTVLFISLIGYSAMAGAVGGGGLGSVAINYGYQRFNLPIMVATITILVVLVYLIQYLGDYLAKKTSH